MNDSPDDNRTDQQVMQTWLRDTGKLLLDERRLNRDLEEALLESQRLTRELESRNWLLEQTVATLKQELRELAQRYVESQHELSAVRMLQAQNQSTPAPELTESAPDALPAWLSPTPPAAPPLAAPRIRPANQHTPAPGNSAAPPHLRGAQAPPRRRSLP